MDLVSGLIHAGKLAEALVIRVAERHLTCNGCNQPRTTTHPVKVAGVERKMCDSCIVNQRHSGVEVVEEEPPSRTGR